MSVGSGCVQFVRILTIIFNILFLLCAVALLGLGIWILIDKNVVEIVDLVVGDGNADFLKYSAIVLITMGAVLFLICLVGILGAVLMNKVLLGIYIAILVIVFCGEVAGAVLAIVFKDRLLDGMKDVLRDSLEKKYYVNDTGICKATEVGAMWDYVQVKWDCCGIEKPHRSGYEGLRYSMKDICPGLPITNKPLTCCKHKYEDELERIDSDNQQGAVDQFDCRRGHIKAKGCLSELESWVEDYAPVLIGIGFAVAMLQLFGIIFAVCLCVNSRKRS